MLGKIFGSLVVILFGSPNHTICHMHPKCMMSLHVDVFFIASHVWSSFSALLKLPTFGIVCTTHEIDYVSREVTSQINGHPDLKDVLQELQVSSL